MSRPVCYTAFLTWPQTACVKVIKRTLYILLLMVFGFSLLAKKPKAGIYRATLLLNEEKGIELPFNFELKYEGKACVLIIHNAEERIRVDEVILKKDSLNFKMPFFDSEFKTRFKGGTLEGLWINHGRSNKNTLKFKAVHGETRRFLFEPSKNNPVFEGRWETTFSPGTKNSSKAIGVFHHTEQSDYLTGTFLTETGDYRYLEGMKHGQSLSLSCFDGSHAYLFEGKLDDNGLLKGVFYSGAHWEEPWEAKFNRDYKLRKADEITYLKANPEKIEFKFPDLEQQTVSLSDKKFAGKVVILQLMGSWCPNCMDESAYFSELYKQYQAEGLEVIALAFEKTGDFEKAKRLLTRFKTRLNIDYTVLVTQQTGKEKAGEILPFLNEITAFPTTLFLNRDHQIVKIHTGFSGPATGQDYLDFKNETEGLIKTLLKK